MSTVKLTHFHCPGAGNDAPQEGFEVRESDLPDFQPGDFFLDLEDISGDVQVLVTEDLDFDPTDIHSHPW